MSFDIDSVAYIAMAEGRWSEVLRPFSNRVLAPCIARWIGFGALHALATVGFLAMLWWLLRKREATWRAVPFVFAPWVVNFICNPYMPDMLTCALTALFFVLLASGRRGWATLTIVPMMMARESGIVIVLVWAVLSGMGSSVGKWRRVLGILVAAATGMALVRLISADSPGDINGLGPVYMPIKALANGIFSVTGLSPWNDIYAARLPEFYTHPPLWKMSCPECLRLGRFVEIGIYEWHPYQVLTTLRIMALSLGAVVPMFAACRRFRAQLGDEWVRLAFWSAAAYWLLIPISGFSPARYAGYVWPLLLAVAWRQLPVGWRYWALVTVHLGIVACLLPA